MAVVTLRVIDGADRGKIFADVPTPFTVGREEGNPVQLNDDRVSRFHLKIQEDKDTLVLTDLQSTNGTRVNNESVALCVLRPGDVITIGRSVLLVGSRDQIAARLAALRGVDISSGVLLDEDVGESGFSLDEELSHLLDSDALGTLHTLLPPELPAALSVGQAAQLSELLLYFHLRLRGLIATAKALPKSESVVIDQRQWQALLDLQDRLATYLRQIGEPVD